MPKELLSSGKKTMQFPYLQDFAEFLIKNLEKVTKKHLELMMTSDLPMLRHFKDYTQEQLYALSLDSQKDFFTRLSNGTAMEQSLKDLIIFKDNQNPLIKTNQVEAEDFVVGYSLRAKLFHHFIPEYTKDPETILAIVSELENFNSTIQTEAFRVFITIKEEQLRVKNAELTEALETLRQEKELSECILDTSFDSIVAFDTDLRYTLWNSATETLSGIQREKVIGKSLAEAFPEALNEELYNYFSRVLKGEKVYIPPTPYGYKEGYYEGYIAPLKNQNEEITGGISVVRDISELRKKEMELTRAHGELEKRVVQRTDELSRANKELQRINTELEDFAYTVSHDLKAPLRAINTIANFLKEDYGDKIGGDGTSQLDLLTHRVQRMGNLIEGILHYAKAGRDEFQKDEINIAVILKEVMESVETGSNFKLIIHNDLPTVRFPKIPLAQVIQNLIVNAIKYNDKEECKIEVGGEKKDGKILIWIKDNGPGIEDKYHEKVFRPFQTLAPRDQIESTGIGLAVVKKIVEMEGGEVWLESEPGISCTFFISIPE